MVVRRGGREAGESSAGKASTGIPTRRPSSRPFLSPGTAARQSATISAARARTEEVAHVRSLASGWEMTSVERRRV